MFSGMTQSNPSHRVGSYLLVVLITVLPKGSSDEGNACFQGGGVVSGEGVHTSTITKHKSQKCHES